MKGGFKSGLVGVVLVEAGIDTLQGLETTYGWQDTTEKGPCRGKLPLGR